MYIYTPDPPRSTCAQNIYGDPISQPEMSDKFVCRECGRTTYGVSYEWRDKALYGNLVKVGLCEECYQKGRIRIR